MRSTLARHVTVGEIGEGYFIEDDGPGIDPDEVARLFSIARPLTSSKMLRLPTRGALGNGLRVAAGAVLASGGKLAVETRGAQLTLKPGIRTGRPPRRGAPQATSGNAYRDQLRRGPAEGRQRSQLTRKAISLAKGGVSYNGAVVALLVRRRRSSMSFCRPAARRLCGRWSPASMAALAVALARSSPPPASAARPATGRCGRRCEAPQSGSRCRQAGEPEAARRNRRRTIPRLRLRHGPRRGEIRRGPAGADSLRGRGLGEAQPQPTSAEVVASTARRSRPACRCRRTRATSTCSAAALRTTSARPPTRASRSTST